MVFIGNETSMVVHSEDCEIAEEIIYRVEFDNLYDALGQGFQEAGCCLTDRPYFVLKESHKSRAQNKARLKVGGCVICGHKKYVELAHIIPRQLGGVHRIPLCPNHHKGYDEGHLTQHELAVLKGQVLESHGYAASASVDRMHGAVGELRGVNG